MKNILNVIMSLDYYVCLDLKWNNKILHESYVMSVWCSNKHTNIIWTTTLAEFRQYGSWPNGVHTKNKKRKLYQHLKCSVSDAQQPKGNQSLQIPGGFCGNICSRNTCLICHCCGSWLEISSDFLFSDDITTLKRKETFL